MMKFSRVMGDKEYILRFEFPEPESYVFELKLGALNPTVKDGVYVIFDVYGFLDDGFQFVGSVQGSMNINTNPFVMIDVNSGKQFGAETIEQAIATWYEFFIS